MAKRTVDDLTGWLHARDGIAHRADLLAAGFPVALLRTFARDGGVEVIRRAWFALPSAHAHLVTAARAAGRVSCVAFARERGWWMPDGVDARPHLHKVPGTGSVRMPAGWSGVLHWTTSIGALPARNLRTSVHDALAHIALCLSYDDALVLWESAAQKERISADTLRAVKWRTPAARELAGAVQGLSDSGLETTLLVPLRRWGVQIRQQVWLAGHPVDLLIGERLVVQVDGFQFHADSASRSRDIAHDAELRLRGYTVLRFSYAQVVHNRAQVERVIGHALAQGLHLAA